MGTRPGVAESLHFSIRHFNPDHVVVFAPERARRDNSEILERFGIEAGDLQQTDDEIRGETQDGVYSGLTWYLPRDPALELTDDAEALHLAYRRIMECEFRRHGGNRALRQNAVADFSRGTRPMSSALFGAASALNVEIIAYVTGERDDHGRVIPGTERAHTTRGRRLDATRRTEKAVALFNRGEYTEVQQVTAELDELPDVLLPRGGDARRLLQEAAAALEAWDRFRFEEANDHFQQLGDAQQVDPGLVGQHFVAKDDRHDIQRHLSIVDDADLDLELLADVAANARRRLDEGAHDDALGRLYRALEYTAQLRLDEQFDYETAEFPVDRLPDPLQRTVDCTGETCRLAQHQTWRFLALEGDELGELYERLLDETDLKVAINQRNHSLLAHGFDPVGEDYVRCMDDAVDRLARRGWGDQRWERALEVCEFPEIEAFAL